MPDYEFVDDLTSDVLFKAYGKDADELFENAARAMFSIICEPALPLKQIIIEVEAQDIENLLYQWLSRLLAESEIKGLFFSKFKVKVNGDKLSAKVWGAPANPAKGLTQVKAITMYKFSVAIAKEGLTATVSCDI